MVRQHDVAGSGSREWTRARPMDGRLSRQREPLPTRVEDLPDLPSSYGDALAAGLDALRITLDPGARAAIDGHVRLLLAWTTAINLTSTREPAEVARHRPIP